MCKTIYFKCRNKIKNLDWLAEFPVKHEGNSPAVVGFPTEYLTIYCVSNQLWHPQEKQHQIPGALPRQEDELGNAASQLFQSWLVAGTHNIGFWSQFCWLRDWFHSLPGLRLLPKAWSQTYRPAGQCCVRYLGLPPDCSQKWIKKWSEVNFMLQTRSLGWQSPAWTHPWRQEGHLCVVLMDTGQTSEKRLLIQKGFIHRNEVGFWPQNCSYNFN